MNQFSRISKMTIALLLLAYCCCAQDSSNLYNRILHFPDRLFKKVDDKSADITRRLMKQSAKYLQQFAKEERRLKRRLAKKDSTAAKKIFDDAAQEYADLQTKMLSLTGKASSLRNQYIPHLDTLKTSFNFLSTTEDLLNHKTGTQIKVKEAIAKIDVLQQKFNQAEEVKNFIARRRQILQEQMGKYGLGKQLGNFKKRVYYYQAQVEEYKQMFDEPSKLEAKAIELLTKTSVFREFFSKHSELASLFRLPGASSPGNLNAVFAGLQTRDAVQQEILSRHGSAPDIQQMMKQQVQEAQAQLRQLKDKVSKLGGIGASEEMPDFKPNNQKTKPFADRLEFGSNLQTVRPNKFFPSTSDIGLSIGYKLNDKSIIGIGTSYKVGWGKDIRHIRITHQGVGARSFLDYKIKGSFWLSGGAEMNYRSDFNNFEILNNYSAWQKSALIGLSKKYKVSTKVKGSAKLMYDALWRAQVPRTQPLIFRIGYSL